MIEGNLSFDSYYTINEYIDDIRENAEEFLQTMVIEYAYPERRMIEFLVLDYG